MIFDEAFLNKFYSNIGKPNKIEIPHYKIVKVKD